MDWQAVHDNYPVNKELIWLNNCGTVPAGRHITGAMKEYMEAYARKGTLSEHVDMKVINGRIKEILSRLTGCSPDELCIVHNTAEGLNIISHGIRFDPGDEIVVLEYEYPSNYYPWCHLEASGVHLVTTPMEDSPERFLESLKSRISEKTRLVAISAAHWCTGMPLPVADVGKICRDKGIAYVIDGAQGVGLYPIHLKEHSVDFMAFSAWKWLMGPVGLGVLYVSKEHIDTLNPVFTGVNSVENDHVYFPYRNTWKPTADKFAYSTPNYNDWVYFDAALRYLDGIGFEQVRNRVFELAAYLKEELKKIGFQVFSDHFSGYETGVIVCEKPGVAAEHIARYLRSKNVICAERLGRIRLAPHIFILPSQIDEVISILKSM